MALTRNAAHIAGLGMVVTGTHAFTTTGTTVEVNLGGTMRWINGVMGLTRVGTAAPTSAEEIYLAEEINADGIVEVPADGNVTVARKVEEAGTVTSGLIFSYAFVGGG